MHLVASSNGCILATEFALQYLRSVASAWGPFVRAVAYGAKGAGACLVTCGRTFAELSSGEQPRRCVRNAPAHLTWPCAPAWPRRRVAVAIFRDPFARDVCRPGLGWKPGVNSTNPIQGFGPYFCMFRPDARAPPPHVLPAIWGRARHVTTRFRPPLMSRPKFRALPSMPRRPALWLEEARLHRRSPPPRRRARPRNRRRKSRY